ncbi:MAG: ABC transporter ATP-binding protein [Chloroflexia bacterium]
MSIPIRQYVALLAQYLKPQQLRVALLAALLVTWIGLQVVNPQIVRYFIDEAGKGAPLEQLGWAALLFLGVAILSQMLSVLATYVGENVGWTATNSLRVNLALHSLKLDMPFHKTHTPGEMIERIDGDVTALTRFFSQFVIHVLANLLLMVGVVIVLAWEDWRLALAVGGFVALTLVVLSAIRNLGVEAMTNERQASADLFGFLEERLSGLNDIRANGAGAHAIRGLALVAQGLYRTGRRAWEREGRMWGIMISVFAFGTVLTLSVGTSLFQAGALTLGTMFMLYQYTEMLRQPLNRIAEELRELQKASAGIGRVQTLFDTGIEVKEGPGVSFPRGPLEVEFDRVMFGYGEDEMVLKDMTFKLAPGRVLGLLGRTGSGKTTITRLLFRLYDPEVGVIRLGGHDIREVRLDDLRTSIGMVTQDVQLFAASVRDNLTLFDPSVPDEKVLEVLRDLGMYSWFQSLRDGLDTEIGPHGSGLSAGQAQLLAFARVFLKDPGLVILDEASSRLDPATEALIERAVERLLRNRTGIIIAHRLNTVQRADEIMILENGEIVEHGERVTLVADPTSRFSRLLRTGLEEVLV